MHFTTGENLSRKKM